MKAKSIMFTALILAAGCGPNASNKVSFSAKVSGVSAGQPLTSAGSAGPVQLTGLKMVIKEIKLTPADNPSDAGVPANELARGPYLIDLSGSQLSSGTVNRVFEADPMPGVYKQIKFRVHKVEDADAVKPELAALKGKSVVVEGTYSGSSFTFVSALDEELEREGRFKLGAGGENITMTFDTSRWFKDAAGRDLDPRLQENKSAIESNIKASIDAFEDDERIGVKR